MSRATLTGKIDAIFPTEQKTANFSVRPFWIVEQDARYPRTWEIQCQNSDCATLDRFEHGNLVQVEVEIMGKVSKDGSRVYTNLKADGIKLLRK